MPRSTGKQADLLKSPDDSQYALRSIFEKEMGQTSMPVKHDKTAALMLSWHPDDDDMCVADEIDTLAQVLDKTYRFSVEKKVFHTKQSNPRIQAYLHLSDFVHRHDSDNTLLIVYYAGHGGSALESGKITLSGRSPSGTAEDNDPGRTFDWTEAERVLDKTKADVFVIFDCCNAGILCRPATRDQARSFQIFGACAADGTTRSPGPNSFTTALTWALKKLASKPGFSVTELATMVSRAPNFPKDQFPQLYGGRFEPSVEYIYIAPMPAPGSSSNEAPGQYRHEAVARTKAFELLDLRFCFARPLSNSQLKDFARDLRYMLHHHSKVPCARVAFLRKSSVEEWANMKWHEVVDIVRERAASQSSATTPVVVPDSAVSAQQQQKFGSHLSLPTIDTTHVDSDASTISPSPTAEVREDTPLLNGNGCPAKGSLEQNEENVSHHLATAGRMLMAKAGSSLARAMPCFPRKRHGARQ